MPAFLSAYSAVIPAVSSVTVSPEIIPPERVPSPAVADVVPSYVLLISPNVTVSSFAVILPVPAADMM